MQTLKLSVKKLIGFFSESYSEFNKVTWPSREETTRLTAYVIGVSLGVALFVWLIDLLLQSLLASLIS